ncbi:MAG: alpha/beta hydrolase [Clostridia bacterium]|nr:alpha/beta hydrolase [Clostridia bacterium]
MKTWKLLLGIGGTLALGSAAAMIWTYEKAFRPQNAREKIPENLPDLRQVDDYRDEIFHNMETFQAHACEEVFIQSQDGLRLHGRFYMGEAGAPLVIAFHGFRSSSLRDLSGGMEFYRSHGLSLLLVDQRACGESEGRAITFGIKERYDCLAWALYADERLGGKTPIFLSGISMGAATVLMASDLDLPASVKGIIADCPYTSPEDILVKAGGEMHFPTLPARLLLRSSARVLGGFGLNESSAEKAVANTKVPLLILHGEDDDFVPTAMGEAIAKTAKEGMAEFYTFPGAAHEFSYLSDKERYQRLVCDFILKNSGYDLLKKA